MFSVIPIDVQNMPSGSRASFNSEPGSRIAAAFTGLITLMPPRKKTLSPQLTTCSPRRACTGTCPRLKLVQTKASRSSAFLPTLRSASGVNGVLARSLSMFT